MATTTVKPALPTLDEIDWDNPTPLTENSIRGLYCSAYSFRECGFYVTKDGEKRALKGRGPTPIKAWESKTEYFYSLGKKCTTFAVIDVDCHEDDVNRDIFHALEQVKLICRLLQKCGIKFMVWVSSVDEYGPRGFHIQMYWSRPQSSFYLGARLDTLLDGYDVEIYPSLNRGIRFPRGSLIYTSTSSFSSVANSSFADLPAPRFGARRSPNKERLTTNYVHGREDFDVQSYIPDRQGVRHQRLREMVLVAKRQGYTDEQVSKLARTIWEKNEHTKTPLKEHMSECHSWLKSFDISKCTGDGSGWHEFWTTQKFKSPEDLFRKSQARANYLGYADFPMPAREYAAIWGFSTGKAHKDLMRFVKDGTLSLTSRGDRTRSNLYRLKEKRDEREDSQTATREQGKCGLQDSPRGDTREETRGRGYHQADDQGRSPIGAENPTAGIRRDDGTTSGPHGLDEEGVQASGFDREGDGGGENAPDRSSVGGISSANAGRDSSDLETQTPIERAGNALPDEEHAREIEEWFEEHWDDDLSDEKSSQKCRNNLEKSGG